VDIKIEEVVEIPFVTILLSCSTKALNSIEGHEIRGNPVKVIEMASMTALDCKISYLYIFLAGIHFVVEILQGNR